MSSPADLLPVAATRTSSALTVATAAAAVGPCLVWYGSWHLTRGTGGLIDQLDSNGTWAVGWTDPAAPLSPPDRVLTVGSTTPAPPAYLASFDRLEVERRRSLIKAMLDSLR